MVDDADDALQAALVQQQEFWNAQRQEADEALDAMQPPMAAAVAKAGVGQDAGRDVLAPTFHQCNPVWS